MIQNLNRPQSHEWSPNLSKKALNQRVGGLAAEEGSASLNRTSVDMWESICLPLYIETSLPLSLAEAGWGEAPRLMGVAKSKSSVPSTTAGTHWISDIIGSAEIRSCRGQDFEAAWKLLGPAISSEGAGLGNDTEPDAVSVLRLTKKASLASMFTLFPRTFLTFCAAHVEASRNFTSTFPYSQTLPALLQRLQEGLTSSHWKNQHRDNNHNR